MAYLDADELRAFYVRKPWKIALDVLAIWTVILVSIWASAVTQHPAVTLAALVAIAARQHALNNMVHEAAHYLVARNKVLNDALSDLMFAAPQGILTQGYRSKHLAHHTDLGDPVLDTEFKARYSVRGWKFLTRSIAVLVGGAAAATAGTYKGTVIGAAAHRVRLVLLAAATNGGLMAYCWWLGAPLGWFYLWLLPLLTLTPYLATLRVLAEHQSRDYARSGREDFESQLEPAITRSIPAGRIARFLLAPANFCYHFEHHRFPAVPYTSLPGLYRLLQERGFYARNPQFHGRSYASVLAGLIRPASPLASRSK